MAGVSIKSINAGISIPVLAATKIDPGDMPELSAQDERTEAAATYYADRPTNRIDMVSCHQGIFIAAHRFARIALEIFRLLSTR